MARRSCRRLQYAEQARFEPYPAVTAHKHQICRGFQHAELLTAYIRNKSTSVGSIGINRGIEFIRPPSLVSLQEQITTRNISTSVRLRNLFELPGEGIHTPNSRPHLVVEGLNDLIGWIS